MTLTATFSRLLRHHREAQGLSQEELAARTGLDRTYVSQLERGLKSPTLTSLAKLASCLQIEPASLIRELADVEVATGPRVESDYIVRDAKNIEIKRERGTVTVPAMALLSAIDTAHLLIDEIYSIDLDIASILGLRNLSAFFGELIASAVVKTTGGMFQPNPHQDGYPDLLLMDNVGQQEWERLKNHMNEKGPFSPFPGGGIEVKATCGSIPSPQQCRAKGFVRPGLGDTRVKYLSGYDWKAHHRETNNLAGIVWDFIDGRPRVAALFYSSSLAPEDWGKIVQPRAGGGRTTSVSIMQSSGIRKMYEGWICVIGSAGYAEFLNKKNRGNLIPESQPSL